MSTQKIQFRAFGIGLGRTGTTTICDALTILGYRNVIHNPQLDDLPYVDGAADNGCTVFYKYLDHIFPGSKFILTVRDLDSWLESSKYINERYRVGPKDHVPIMRRMLLYETVTFDRDAYTAAYHRHHADVKRYFRDRPNDLLVMNLIEGDGWEVLCPFLGLPVPDRPMPHSNSRGSGRGKLASGVSRPARLVKKLVQRALGPRFH